MCIIDKEWDLGYGPSYGDIDEVVSECESWGCIFFELQRFLGDVFWAENFIPISDLDEMELVNEKEEVYAG